MSESSTSSPAGIGFVGLLTIVFITLKLIGKITWSWWWVLSPVWITASASLLLIVAIIVGAFISVALDDRK